MKLWFQRFINARFVPKDFSVHNAKMSDQAWSPSQETALLNYAQHTRDSHHDHYTGTKVGFQGRIQDAITSGKNLQLTINDDFPTTVIDFPSIRNRITRIDISTHHEQILEFKSVEILQFHITGPATRHMIIFDQCHIRELSIYDDQAVYLDLKNTWISTLNLKKNAIRHLEVNGGGVLSLVVQSGEINNPFSGPVIIRNLYLPREAGTDMNPQRLRDIRSHLLKMNNMLAAGVFHSAELALDRSLESIPNRFFSWIYEIMADFGNSPSRALKSLLFFFALMTCLCFFAGAIKEPEGPEVIGWKESLVGSSVEAKLLRSLTYSISSILNPLGIIQSKPILISTSPYWTTGLALVGLGGTLSVIFLVIAIRRRFKLE
ncbi:hypothetical protein [Ferrovibrio terrae]|uniref:hypothetical protein n=1 Tax=Ferrovibrio terrae TaxID=2594003 RepID=UPI003137CD69